MSTAIAVQTRTAVGYFRVSTTGQAGERNVSLDVPEAAFRGYCRGNDLVASASFTDVASGHKDARPQYLAMLAYIASNRVDTVVVLFLDRFGRNPREILRRYWELEEAGTAVESVNEDLREELLLLVRSGIAGAESKRISERVTMSLQKAAAKGNLTNKLPFGLRKVYDSHGHPSHAEQVPEEAAVVREAFDMAVSNMGYKAIADELNRRGRRTRKDKLWATQTVKLLLTNQAIAGHFVFHGAAETVEHRDVYPAILDVDEWQRLQERLTIRRERVRGKSGKSDYLLSGIARCGECGAALSGENKGKHRYYTCAARKMARGRCPDGRNHRQEALETAILEHLGQYVDPERVRELLDTQGEESDNQAEADLTRVTARLGELEHGFLNDLDRVDRGIMTEPEYLKRQESRREEQESLTARKADLESSVAAQREVESQTAAVPVQVRSFLEDFGDMDVPGAKAILQGIIKAAHVYNDGRIDLEFRG